MDTSPAPESLRDLLLRHRGRTGLTQRELAHRTGANRRTVQDWEAGVNYPSADLLKALIRVVLVSPTELFGAVRHPQVDTVRADDADLLDERMIEIALQGPAADSLTHQLLLGSVRLDQPARFSWRAQRWYAWN